MKSAIARIGTLVLIVMSDPSLRTNINKVLNQR